MRYRAEARLAGRSDGEPFGVNVGFEGALLGEADVANAEDLLGSAGIGAPKLRLYLVESHIAEKFHAYTLPRARRNSREEDLRDLVVHAKIRPIETRAVRGAIDGTFTFCKNHDTPSAVLDAPVEWDEVFQPTVQQDEVECQMIDALMNAVRAHLGPILSGEDVDRWSPEDWRWHVPRLYTR